MLTMSAAAAAVVLRSHTIDLRVSSWRAGLLLADDVPASDGTDTRDRSLTVPESISLTVPRTDRGTAWDPQSPDHPLAAYGQQLYISTGVDTGAAGTEWIDRGWFLITSAQTDGDTVNVTCQGLLALIDEAKFAAPFQPSGTLASTIQSLVEPALTVQFDGTLVDRPVPVGMQWDTDRMAALNEVLDAWPATCRVTRSGYLLVEPLTDTGTPVMSLTDGTGGTVIKWQGTASRDGAFNCVIAQGTDPSGNQIQGVAYDTVSTSPFRVGGPFSPLIVPYTMSSPLLSTVDQCRTAAATALRRLRRTASLKLAASIVPHPGLMTGDVVSVTGAGLTNALAMIEALTYPLYGATEMTLTLRLI